MFSGAKKRDESLHYSDQLSDDSKHLQAVPTLKSIKFNIPTFTLPPNHIYKKCLLGGNDDI